MTDDFKRRLIAHAKVAVERAGRGPHVRKARALSALVAGVLCIVAASGAAAQREYDFYGIRWGETASRMPALLRGMGVTEVHIDSAGDIAGVWNDRRIRAVIGGGRLVAVEAYTDVRGGSLVEETRRTVEQLTELFGSAPQRRTGWWLWNGDSTGVMVAVADEGEAGEEVKVVWWHQQYSAELNRRIGQAYANLDRLERAWHDNLNLDARWRRVYVSESAAISFDQSRVTRTPSLIVWIRFDFSEAIAMRAYPHRTYDGYIHRAEISCSSLRMRSFSVVFYRDGQVIDSNTFSRPIWEDVVPGSLGETAVVEICRVLRPRRSR